LKKYFGSYTQGHDWNAPGAITDEDKGGPNNFVLKEEGILDTLKNKASSFAKTDGVPDGAGFFELIIDIANGINRITRCTFSKVFTPSRNCISPWDLPERFIIST
jgi:hypothetical protein